MEEYATELFNSWGIGSAEKNNGVLILLSIGDDDYWVVQGKGLETTLKTGKIAEFLDEYLEPDFAAKNYGEGAAKLYRVLVEFLGGTWSTEMAVPEADADVMPVNQEVDDPPKKEGNLVYRIVLKIEELLLIGAALIFVLVITSPLLALFITVLLAVLSVLISPIYLSLVCIFRARRRHYLGKYGVPFNPYSKWRIRKYGPEGYWRDFRPPPQDYGDWFENQRWHGIDATRDHQDSPNPSPNVIPMPFTTPTHIPISAPPLRRPRPRRENPTPIWILKPELLNTGGRVGRTSSRGSSSSSSSSKQSNSSSSGAGGRTRGGGAGRSSSGGLLSILFSSTDSSEKSSSSSSSWGSSSGGGGSTRGGGAGRSTSSYSSSSSSSSYSSSSSSSSSSSGASYSGGGGTTRGGGAGRRKG